MLSASGAWHALGACKRVAGAALGRALLHGSSWVAAEEAQAAAVATAAANNPLTDSDFDLTEDQQQFKHVAEMFAREELAPFRCLHDCIVARMPTSLVPSDRLCMEPQSRSRPNRLLPAPPACSAEWDERHHFPVETLKKAADLGAHYEPLRPQDGAQTVLPAQPI